MPRLSDAQMELRRKQVNEVLNVWNDVQRQVFQRERTHVADMDLSLLPKKTRDVEAEVNVDAMINNLNQVMEVKMLALERCLSAYDEKSFAQVVLVGEVLTAFNAVIRVYSAPALSRASRELILLKLQSLSPHINALVFGCDELTNLLFERAPDKRIYNLIRANTVYRIIKKQIDANNYYVIDKSALDAEFRQILSEQSQERREFLSALAERDINEAPLYGRLKQYPVFSSNLNARIAELQDELGVDIGEDLRDEFNRLPDNQAVSEVERLKQLNRSAVPLYTREEEANLEIEQNIEQIEQDKHDFQVAQSHLESTRIRLQEVVQLIAYIQRNYKKVNTEVTRLERSEVTLAQVTSPEAQKFKRRLASLRATLKSQLRDINSAYANKERLEYEIAQYEEQLSDLANRIGKRRNQVTTKSSEINQIQDELRELGSVAEINGKKQRLGQGMKKVVTRGMANMVNDYRMVEPKEEKKVEKEETVKQRAKHVPIRFNENANEIYNGVKNKK
jgi:hypothetical protein